MRKDKEKYNKWFRDYYQKNKQRYIDKAEAYKAKRVAWFYEHFKDILFCSRCPEKDKRCLDFHHTDPSKKDETISRLIRAGSKKRLEEEMKKCIVLCANCHRKEHASLM